MRRVRWILLLFLAIYALTGLHQIRPEERAVVQRFGRIVARPGPGLWVGLPWGIDRVERVPITQVQRVTIGFSPDGDPDALANGLLLTGDENLVALEVHVDYAVAEGDAALDQFVLQRSRSEAVIRREAEASLAEWASGQRFDAILLAGSSNLPRWLAPRVQERIAPYGLGVRILNASVASATPPDGVRRDFERVNQAESLNRQREFRAMQERNQRLREAENIRYKLASEALADSENRQRLAIADAETYRQRLDQYQQARQRIPNMLEIIWSEEMTRSIQGYRDRGRFDLLDSHLGPDGLDLIRILPAIKKR